MPTTEDEFDYGPLAALVGTWTGDKGVDVAPEPDGEERSPYFETLTFAGCGDATNAESQKLTAVRYHQVVSRRKTGKVFHDQIGYWLWDAERQTVIQSLAIPRAVCLLAGGKSAGAQDSSTGLVIEVAAKLGDPDWGILQSPFMRDTASSLEFRHKITVKGDHMHYFESTVVDIYGRRFDHTDENDLVRVR